MLPRWRGRLYGVVARRECADCVWTGGSTRLQLLQEAHQEAPNRGEDPTEGAGAGEGGSGEEAQTGSQGGEYR